MARKHKFFECHFQLEQHGILKNNKKIRKTPKGRRFVTKSDRAMLIQKEYTYMFKYFKDLYGLNWTCRNPVSMKATFYFKDYYTQAGKTSRKLPDLSNLYQMVEDALEAARIIDNDTLIDNHDGSSRRPSTNGCNSLHIELFEIKNHNYYIK